MIAKYGWSRFKILPREDRLTTEIELKNCPAGNYVFTNE
jgi:hypothetical protein